MKIFGPSNEGDETPDGDSSPFVHLVRDVRQNLYLRILVLIIDSVQEYGSLGTSRWCFRGYFSVCTRNKSFLNPRC